MQNPKLAPHVVVYYKWDDLPGERDLILIQKDRRFLDMKLTPWSVVFTRRQGIDRLANHSHVYVLVSALAMAYSANRVFTLTVDEFIYNGWAQLPSNVIMDYFIEHSDVPDAVKSIIESIGWSGELE